MKKQSLLLLVVAMLGVSIPAFAQNELSDNTVDQSNSSGGELKKGEFHIGIQDLSVAFYGGRTYINVAPRFGYMISNKDMVFTAVSLSGLSGISMYTIEASLNYRRYFGDKAFKPFAQIGAGYGYFQYPENSFITNRSGNYFHANTGVGVSYRYKRWSFEAGMQLIYNQLNNNELVLKPMVGASFSF